MLRKRGESLDHAERLKTDIERLSDERDRLLEKHAEAALRVEAAMSKIATVVERATDDRHATDDLQKASEDK